MSSVTLRMPEDVVDDLKRIAPTLGYAGYQPLIRSSARVCAPISRAWTKGPCRG